VTRDRSVGDRFDKPNDITVTNDFATVEATTTTVLRVDADGAMVRELVGVAHEIEQRLPQPHLVGMQRPDRAIRFDSDLIGVLRCQWFDRLHHVGDQRRKRECFELQLHSPRLDLGEVQDVIDQRKEMSARAEDAVERLRILF